MAGTGRRTGPLIAPACYFSDRRSALIPAIRVASISLLCLVQPLPLLTAQPGKPQDAELKFVVYLSRHGVRSPTGKADQYNSYSAASWPTWDVPPGYLTAHGFELMTLFGAYDRAEFANQGLLSANGCDDARRVTFYSDSDQRTRETGKALAAGFFPDCSTTVDSLPEGATDPLFHSNRTARSLEESSLETAAIAGRIGGNPNGLTAVFHSQLAELDKLLATCGANASDPNPRISLFDVPATLSSGHNDHAAELRGPLNTAATLTENLLLEYTEGIDAANVGWGCVDGAKLRSLLVLHTAAEDFTARTPAIARIQGSRLLEQILLSLEQAVTGKRIPGALSKPSDRALILVGHDTNLANIAGLLSLNWIADARRDDTPPGGAIIFELWRSRNTGGLFVRAYFTSQTLEQMRSACPLSPENPPERVPLFVPGCSSEDFSCSWPSFAQIIRQAIHPRSTSAR
jgi:4-phytase/acid phosphatase